MSTDSDQKAGTNSSPAGSNRPKMNVVAIHQPGAELDEKLLDTLTRALTENGLAVFADRDTTHGVEWAKEIEKKIRAADVVIPLLSEHSVVNETVAFQVEIAHERSQKHQGRPGIVPVRVAFTGPLPAPLSGMLNTIQHLLWEGASDDALIVKQVLAAVHSTEQVNAPAVIPGETSKRLIAKTVPAPKSRSTAKAKPGTAEPGDTSRAGIVEPIGGAVPVDSKFYVVRPADVEFRTALSRHDSVILIKGARQIGKTSLLARGLKFSRENKARVAMTDFQKFNATNLETVGNLQLSLAESLADQLDLRVLPSDVWDERRSPNVNFERYLRREVLAQVDGHLVWGLDEVDRLFAYPYASEVFGLFRSWHNERALDPTGPWSQLTLAIAYATEAHLFITDVNQSPFNIGTRLTLEDFYPNQVAELNQLYGKPLKDKGELDQFTNLLGGHPYLVRRGLHEMSKRKITLKALIEKAPRDDSAFGDHLRRILVLLARDVPLTEVVKSLLQGKPCPDPESFYRLRSSGIIKGTSPTDAHPRCELYATYLSQHLLEADWSPQV